MSYSLFVGGSKRLTVEELRPIIFQSYSAWTSVRCDGVPIQLDVAETEAASLCDRSVFNSEGGNLNTVAFVADWVARDHDPDAFALTSVWHDSAGLIHDADMELNEENRTFDDCPVGASCPFVDVQNVVTHEAGHFFGLAHSSDPEATMLASAPTGEIKKRTLAADDIDGICNAYPPGSLPDTCDFTPSGGFAAECRVEDGCGCRAPGSTRRFPRFAAFAVGAVALAMAWARRRRR